MTTATKGTVQRSTPCRALPMPTPFQSRLVNRAHDAKRWVKYFPLFMDYTERELDDGTTVPNSATQQSHGQLWSILHAVARDVIKLRDLWWLRTTDDKGKTTLDSSTLIDHWAACTPDDQTAGNTVSRDDMGADFDTLAQSLNVPESAMVSVDDDEKWGSDYLPLHAEDGLEVAADEYADAKARLSSLVDWLEGIHPVTSGQHLPSWRSQEADEEDPEEHLEDEFLGFEGFGVPARGKQWQHTQRTISLLRHRIPCTILHLLHDD